MLYNPGIWPFLPANKLGIVMCFTCTICLAKYQGYYTFKILLGLRFSIHSNSFGSPQIILKGWFPLHLYWCFSSGLFAALMSSPFGLGFPAWVLRGWSGQSRLLLRAAPSRFHPPAHPSPQWCNSCETQIDLRSELNNYVYLYHIGTYIVIWW